MLVYADQKYDPQDPWSGLFRGKLLVWVGFITLLLLVCQLFCLQGFKHIFTSPSSVENEAKATRSGNARIHGMTRVTTASIAYTATQVRQSLLLLTVFTLRAGSLCLIVVLGIL